VKNKLVPLVLVLLLTSCGGMKLATNSGYSITPKVKTESELKKANNAKIVFGIIILISLFIGDRLKVI
jgi:UPF0716 family protein affecting phage T7 exclusion